MLDRKTIEALGGWKGYRVERFVWPERDSHTVIIHLKPSARLCSASIAAADVGRA